MFSQKDDSLYKLLNVERTADENTIKKSYRKLALKHHPDRNKDNKEEAESKFKEISSAYEILSDKEKRKIYDAHGLDAVRNSGDGNINPFDIFNNLFKEGDASNMFGNSFFSRGSQQTHNKPRVEQITVSLEDLYLENTLKLKINKKVIDPDTKIRHCEACDGQGKITQMRQIGPGLVTQSATICPKCNGKGKIFNMKSISKVLDIKLSNKYKHESQIVIEGEGHENYQKYGDSKSDLILIINETGHLNFKRDGNNLIYNADILLSDALCGVELVITQLDKRKLLIKTNEIITPLSKKRIIGEGMNNNGNMIINFNIIFPSTLSDERKQYLSKILPIKNRSKINLNDYEIKIIEDYNNSEPNFEFNGKEEPLFDDDETAHTGQQVNCAQQ